jgi:hypothetical protein
MKPLLLEQNSVFLLGGLVCMVAASAILSALPFSLLKRLRIMVLDKPCVVTRELDSFDLPPLLSITIEKASEGLNSGHFTSVDLVKAYLARIEEASEFNAVLQVNPDAITAAQHLDDERVRLGSRGYVLCSSSSCT